MLKSLLGEEKYKEFEKKFAEVLEIYSETKTRIYFEAGWYAREMYSDELSRKQDKLNTDYEFKKIQNKQIHKIKIGEK